jgi:hypothetical protein
VFTLDPAHALETTTFPSEVIFGWNPPLGSGGAVVNQSRFREIYAKRPFGITVRPDSNRALVSFYQTGNFGVLDLEQQSLFPNPFLQSPTGYFTGLVGVTPALRLDSHLWPSRGAFRSPDGLTIPSPDEALLFPTTIEYAQNGRFAVAVHTGAQSPVKVEAALPDFQNDTRARQSLREIGFDIAGDSASGRDPDGNIVESFDSYVFDRGGGAISVILDDPVTADLSANAGGIVTAADGSLRPYYASRPVCGVADPAGPRCTQEASTKLFSYRPTAGTSVRFDRPRGVAVQPFVSILSPRFGDQVTPGSNMTLAWRDPRVFRIRVRVFDLGTPGQIGARTQIATINKVLTNAQIARRAASFPFRFFLNGQPPATGHRYLFEIAVMTVFDQVISLVDHELQLR